LRKGRAAEDAYRAREHCKTQELSNRHRRILQRVVPCLFLQFGGSGIAGSSPRVTAPAT
jgi:hypothetical protein